MINIKLEKYPQFLFLLLVFFIVLHKGEAQNTINDSLKNYSLAELRDKFVANYTNDAKNKIYANAYLLEAKTLKDSFQMAEGYYMLSLVSNKDKLNLYDNIISISKNFKGKNYPATAYLDKGTYFYNNWKYSQALDNFLQAKKFNHGSNKLWLEFLINSSIGSLKLRTEENEEALKIFRDTYRYSIEKDIKSKYISKHLGELFGLTNALRKTNKLDSAQTYARLGVIESRESENDTYYNLFNLLEGILATTSNPKLSISKLEESKAYFVSQNDSINSAIAFQYLGQAQANLGNQKKALYNFKRVDRLISNKINILPELLYSYKILRDEASTSKNAKSELYYTKKIISFDSIFKLEYRDINSKIRREYDLPILLENRDNLIQDLKVANTRNQKSLWIALSILLFAIIILIYQFQLKRKYQKRFDELINKKKEAQIVSEKVSGAKNDVLTKELNISKEIVDRIIENIEKIHLEKLYLDRNIKTTSLAKVIGTNNSYYTKVFKSHVGYSFNQYIKELRIAYAFDKLKNDSTFRKFTIKAVALDCGFKNSESFSKSFYQVYGIYPSFFIKKLNSQNP